ncbi:MAG: hypothetical protein EB117_18330 [Betaproteobacteria bacterium]|nr:hypothetical protein [Betaproteobacteria bacterium]
MQREQRRQEGKFDSYDYTINFSPSMKNTDTEKYRHGKNPTRKNSALINKDLEEINTIINKDLDKEDDEKQSFSTNEQNKFSENKLNPFTIVANVQSIKEKEKNCLKKEKESQAEPKAVNKTYHAFTIYCQTFEAISGAAYPTDQNGHYIMTKKDAGSMVYLMRFIDQIDRSGNWEEALKIFINAAWNLKDKWLQANFTPAILYSQSSKIFTAYQTSSPAAKEKAYNDEVDRLLAERMKKYQTQ